MKLQTLLCACALTAAAVALAARPMQDAKGGDDMAAMMAAWQKASAKGEAHAAFAKDVGTWDLTVKAWMDPKAPPQEYKSTAMRELALDGRFMIEKVSGDMGPFGKFEGLGILGYNNLTKQYDHIWMDSFGTGMLISHGTKGADGAITMHGEYDDAMTGGVTKTRTVTKHTNENEIVFEMYEDRGQGEAQSMEITYVRGKGR